MARWLLIAFVVALLPVVAVVGHAELRRVAMQDIALLLTGEVEMLQPHAGSAERQAVLALERQQPPPDHLTKAGEYVKLYERFRQPYLLAAAIRVVTLQSLFPFPAPDTQEFTERRRRYARELLSLAQRLASVDGQNAFPHLMRCVAWTSLEHRGEALQALQTAAACPTYNGYERDWLRVVSSPSLTAEERLVAPSRGLLFPHLGQLRRACERLRDWANEMEHRGEHEQALQVAEWMMRSGATMRASGDTFIQVLVGTGLERIAWQRQQMPKKSIESAEEEARRLAEQFGRYARQHGRPDLAEQALASAEAYSRALKNFHRASDRWEQRLSKLFSLRAGGVVLQIWAWTWLFCAVSTLLMAPLWYSPPALRDRVLPWTAALPFAGALIALAVAAAQALYPFGKVVQQLVEPIQEPRGDFTTFSLVQQMPLLHQLATLAVGALLLVCFAIPLWRVARGARQPWTAGAVVFGWLLAIALVGGGELFSPENVLLTTAVFVVTLVGLSGLLVAPFYAFRRRQPLPPPFRLGIAALWGLASLTVWAGSPIATALWLVAGLLLWLALGRSLSEELRLETQRAVYRFGMSALILAVFTFWLYAVLGYVSLPVRAQQHAYLDQLIERGEVRALEEAP